MRSMRSAKKRGHHELLIWLRRHAQRAGWSTAQLVRATAEAGESFPCIEFVAEAEACPVCAGEVQIQKSKRRQIITFQAGVCTAKDVRKQCTRNPTHPIMGSEELARLVKPHQRYAYDLVVHVGLARYLRGKQREEIRAELYQERGVRLCEGSISNLCDRFLGYFEALHLDATCEHGKGGLAQSRVLGALPKNAGDPTGHRAPDPSHQSL